MNVYIREKDLDYSAMRGPCPEGFHVPYQKEWRAIIDIRAELGLAEETGQSYYTYLKLPFAGLRGSGGALDHQGSFGYYWSSPYGANSYFFWNGHYDPPTSTTYGGRALAKSVRAFKDSPVKPDSSWTVLYDGSSVATGAGIFHNATLGLISLSGDGFSRITIQDKNLGAVNVGDYGSLFQRGNNYGFPSTGTLSDTSDTQVDATNYGPGNYYSSSTYITGSSDWSSVRNDNLWGHQTGAAPIMTTMKNAYIGEYAPINTSGIYHDATLGLISLSSDGSSWLTITDKNLGATTVYNDGDTLSEANCGKVYQWGNNYGFPLTGSITTSSTRVSTSGYGPNNYYSGSTFITGTNNRSSTSNNDLWGDTTNTLEARKGPCDTGYHIPSISEFEGLINMLNTIGIDISNGEQLKLYLKMPYSGRRDTSGTYGGSNGVLWSSSPQSQDATAMRLSFSSTSLSVTGRSNKTFGATIRPFKNEAVQPYTSRIKLY